jgi:hypothetical protein
MSARQHRKSREPREYKRLLADVEPDQQGQQIEATATALRHLDALEDRYAAQLIE